MNNIWEAAMGISKNANAVKMELCEAHWQMARDALATRGLMAYCTIDEHEASQKQAKRLMGVRTRETFDPIMLYTEIVFANAIEKMGPIDGCPICNVRDSCPCGDPDCTPAGREDSWINKISDFVLKDAKKLGITPIMEA